MIDKACNDFVLILRDETLNEKGGMILSSQGKEKPHVGTIHAVGDLVADKNIQAAVGKKALFHATVGFDIEYEGHVYLVVHDREIIALP